MSSLEKKIEPPQTQPRLSQIMVPIIPAEVQKAPLEPLPAKPQEKLQEVLVVKHDVPQSEPKKTPPQPVEEAVPVGKQDVPKPGSPKTPLEVHKEPEMKKDEPKTSTLPMRKPSARAVDTSPKESILPTRKASSKSVVGTTSILPLRKPSARADLPSDEDE